MTAGGNVRGAVLWRLLPDEYFREPRLISGPLTILASVTYVYDGIPNPNLIFGQIGWLWAIYGVLIAAILLALSLLPAPSAHDLARMEMRLFRAATAKEVSAVQAQQAIAFGNKVKELIAETEGDGTISSSRILRAAQVLRHIRLALWRGLALPIRDEEEGCKDRMTAVFDAMKAAWAGEITADPVVKRRAFPADFLSNRDYGDFALRASLATMFVISL